MRKIVSLILSLVMVFSVSSFVYGETGPTSASTPVTYNGTHNDEYTITVPKSLEPGDSDDVVVTGYIAESRQINVSAPVVIDLKMSNNIDIIRLGVDFEKIILPGDYVNEVSASSTVSLSSVNHNIQVGTWNGNIVFNVSVSNRADYDMQIFDSSGSIGFVMVNSATNSKKYLSAEVGMAWKEWPSSGYKPTNYYIIIENGEVYAEINRNSSEYKKVNVKLDGVNVKADDIIVNGKEYTFN